MAGYKDSEARAEDNLSSAWTLILVGGIGLIVLALGFFGIIPIPISGGGKYLFYGVLAVLCGVFVFAGIISFKKVKVYTAEASTEKSQKQQIIDWCNENQIADKINDAIAVEIADMPEEEAYFRRAEMLKHVIFAQFQNMGITFLSNVADEIYDSLFED